MSEESAKLKENLKGKYYVNHLCIGCMLCSEIAPDNFKPCLDMDSEVEYSFLYKQPSTKLEDDLCAESMDICPVDAIGDDGNVENSQ